jgi:CTP:molybdopterin cytidylyltransferase MocA
VGTAQPQSDAGVAAIVLAAGQGRRLGGLKQLASLRGRRLLDHVLAAANAAPVDCVLLVLGAGADEIAAGVDVGRADVVVCTSWREGMAAPLRAGIDAAGDPDVPVVVLGDQPLVMATAIERVLSARRPGAAAVRATYASVPGHPVVLERALLGRVREIRGDTGARELLAAAGHDVVEIPCDDVADPLDVETVHDLAVAEAMLAS